LTKQQQQLQQQQQQQQQQHGNNEEYFEAIIRESRYVPSEKLYGDGSWQFLVHFIGWNKRWDRWIEYYTPNNNNNNNNDDNNNATLKQNASIYRDTPDIRQQLIEQKKFQVGSNNNNNNNHHHRTNGISNLTPTMECKIHHHHHLLIH
jgi:hypothetical protein